MEKRGVSTALIRVRIPAWSQLNFKMSKHGLLQKQVEFKPFHYPHLLEHRKSIKGSPWHAEEYNYATDIQDFKVHMTSKEQTASKRTMLAVAQVESAAVKHFWGKVHDILPRPEIAMVGYTFAENEVVHSESYSMILDLLGFNEEFEHVLKTDVIGGRVNYLEKYLRGSGDNVDEFNTLKIALFTLFVENVSLFGQFLILRSFKQGPNKLQAIDNVVQATMKDELVHAAFGIDILKILKEENPDWFNEDFYVKIQRAARKAYEAECKIIDWIFEEGDLDFINAYDVKEFLKRRFNESLQEIGCPIVFHELDQESFARTSWMDVDILAYTHNDKFNNKSVNYTRKPVTEQDIQNGIQSFKEEFGI